MLPLMRFDSVRPFGTEIELNAFDGRDTPEVDGRLPEGIDYVGNLVALHSKSNVEVRKWGATNGNTNWVVKPDSSCGIEVCSPVLRGVRGIAHVCGVIGGLAQDPLVEADSRCSFHVHAGVGDHTLEGVGTIMAWWVKCEAALLAAMPPRRRVNKYCRQIGLTDGFRHDSELTPLDLVRMMGDSKYWTANTFHYILGNRQTVEFRIMDEKACRSPDLAFHWTALCLHFIERAVNRGWPRPYRDGDPWTSFLWLDQADVWRFLGFCGRVRLCPVLAGVRDWLATRWASGRSATDARFGLWSPEARAVLNSVVEERHGHETGGEPGLLGVPGRIGGPDEEAGGPSGALHGPPSAS